MLHYLLKLTEVRLPAVMFLQVVGHRHSSEDLAQRGVRRIARVRYQHVVARIDEGQRDMQDAFFRAYQRQYLRLWVEVYVVPAFVEVGHGLTQLWRSLCGLIAVSRRIVSHLAEFLYRLLRRWHIGTADSQADDVLALGIELSHLLQFAAEIVFLYR